MNEFGIRLLMNEFGIRLLVSSMLVAIVGMLLPLHWVPNPVEVRRELGGIALTLLVVSCIVILGG